MKILYADESGNTGIDLDNKQQPIFVLGALSISNENWHKTNNYFNKKKIEIYEDFKNIEIHTNEIFNPPHKSKFHTKNWKDNFVLLDNIVDLIMKLDIEFTFIAIDKKTYKKESQQHFGKDIRINPYIYGFSMLYNLIAKELEKNNDKGIIFLDEIIDIPQELNKIYPKLAINNTSIIEQALFLKSKDANFIQIADVFSFYVYQYLNICKGYKKYSDFKENHCINNYNKLITKLGKNPLLYF